MSGWMRKVVVIVIAKDARDMTTYFPVSFGSVLMMTSFDNFSFAPLICSLMMYICRPKDMRDKLLIICPFLYQSIFESGTDSAAHSSVPSSPDDGYEMEERGGEEGKKEEAEGERSFHRE